MSYQMNSFFEDVLKKFTNDITDRVFKMIENDKELMQKYLRVVSDNDKDTVNKLLGKKIRQYYNLENGEDENCEPESVLINTYQEHEKNN